MPSTPGRPVSPTIHPRTKSGVAEENALRARTTSDWFRHDGKNIQNDPPPPARLHHQDAHDAAEKNKCKADQWFDHRTEVVPNGEPVIKRSLEADKNSDKIKGVNEKWYKHDNNQGYSSPINTHKVVTGESANNAKDKIGNAETMQWYKHEHSKGDQNGNTLEHSKGKGRIHSNKARPDGPPSWSVYKQSPDSESRRSHHGKAKGGGDYLERNRNGSDWFDHDSAPPLSGEPYTPRCVTAEGANIALKNRAESADWYKQNNAVPDNPVHHKGQTNATKAMVEKSRGGAMEHVMRQPKKAASKSTNHQTSDERGSTPLPPQPEPRVTGEMAHNIQEKNVKGMMDKFMNQDLNKDFQNSRSIPRVRDHAAQSTYVKGQAGVMADCMTGYPGTPTGAAPGGRVVKPEANDNATKGKGTMHKVISAPNTIPTSGRPQQRIKPEAAKYAERNKGTLGVSMHMDGGSSDWGSRPSSRAGNEVAQSLAARNRGTIGNFIFGGG